MKSISAITLDPLDRKTSEDCKRLSQSERYRTVPLSGTFTVKSGVFRRHNFSKAINLRPKIKVTI